MGAGGGVADDGGAKGVLSVEPREEPADLVGREEAAGGGRARKRAEDGALLLEGLELPGPGGEAEEGEGEAT